MDYHNNKIINTYYDSFIQFKQNAVQEYSNRTLRILQFNIRGMNDPDKFDHVKEILTLYPNPIDVVALGETWIKKDRVQHYQIDGYKSVFSCRPDSRGGGLAVFVRDSIVFDTVCNTHSRGLHHINLRLHGMGASLQVHAVYKPPSYRTTEYLDKLESILALQNREASCVIVGDVNIPYNQLENGSVQEYINQLKCYNFCVTNSFPTRPATGNLLDHVVCSEDLQASLLNETVHSDVSDHCMILSSFKLQRSITLRALEKMVVDHTKLNEAFAAEVRNMAQGTPENNLKYVSELYQRLKKQFSRKVVIRAKIKGYCPWMNLPLDIRS